MTGYACWTSEKEIGLFRHAADAKKAARLNTVVPVQAEDYIVLDDWGAKASYTYKGRMSFDELAKLINDRALANVRARAV